METKCKEKNIFKLTTNRTLRHSEVLTQWIFRRIVCQGHLVRRNHSFGMGNEEDFGSFVYDRIEYKTASYIDGFIKPSKENKENDKTQNYL